MGVGLGVERQEELRARDASQRWMCLQPMKWAGMMKAGMGEQAALDGVLMGKLVQENLSISAHAMVDRSQPCKNLQGGRSGQGTQQEQRALGGDMLRVFQEQRETGGTLESANPPCPPLPPALEAKGQAAKGREKDIASLENP